MKKVAESRPLKVVKARFSLWFYHEKNGRCLDILKPNGHARSSFGNTSRGLQFRVHFSKGRGEDQSLAVVVIHVEVDGSALGWKEEWGSQLKSSVLCSLDRSNKLNRRV